MLKKTKFAKKYSDSYFRHSVGDFQTRVWDQAEGIQWLLCLGL